MSSGSNLVNAARAGDVQRVRELLMANVDVECRSQWGRTPLIVAAGEGHDGTVKVLLSKANIDAQDDDGKTALILTAIQGCVTTAKILLEAGARLDVRDKDGKTALQYAREKRNGVSQVLEQQIKEKKLAAALANELADAVSRRNRKDVLRLVEKGAASDARLLTAAAAGREADVVACLAQGDQVDAVQYGMTALTAASENGHEAAVAKLLAAGANVNAVNGDGMTALISASENGHEAVVAKLLAAGANVNAVNGGGKRALDVAKGGVWTMLWTAEFVAASERRHTKSMDEVKEQTAKLTETVGQLVEAVFGCPSDEDTAFRRIVLKEAIVAEDEKRPHVSSTRSDAQKAAQGVGDLQEVTKNFAVDVTEALATLREELRECELRLRLELRQAGTTADTASADGADSVSGVVAAHSEHVPGAAGGEVGGSSTPRSQ